MSLELRENAEENINEMSEAGERVLSFSECPIPDTLVNALKKYYGLAKGEPLGYQNRGGLNTKRVF